MSIPDILVSFRTAKGALGLNGLSGTMEQISDSYEERIKSVKRKASCCDCKTNCLSIGLERCKKNELVLRWAEGKRDNEMYKCLVRDSFNEIEGYATQAYKRQKAAFDELTEELRYASRRRVEIQNNEKVLEVKSKFMAEWEHNLLQRERDITDKETNLDEKSRLLQQEQQALIQKQMEIEDAQEIDNSEVQIIEDNDGESKSKCVICLSSFPTVIFTRCRHLCLCSDCHRGGQVSRCPICRVGQRTANVFLP